MDKVIYGEDDRIEVYQFGDQLQYEAAMATSALIPNNLLKDETDRNGNFKLEAPSLKDRRLCKDIRFGNQITPATCSGFLVGEDILVTAGHCIKSNTCVRSSWVFNFQLDKEDDEDYQFISPQNIYKCAEVIERKLDGYTWDHAIVRLDRKVEGVRPLKFRRQGVVEKGTSLIVTGIPSGLPLKIATGAKVRSSEREEFFMANLDTFGGNSGSPVINEVTGMVEGILVRGEKDYEYNRSKRCKDVKVCKDDECLGESSTKITRLTKLLELDL